MNQKGGSKQKKKPLTGEKRTSTSPGVVSANPVSVFIEKHAFLIALSLVTFISFTVFKDFLLFNKLFLYKDIGSDTINGLYPPMKNTADYIHTVGFPKWSFNYGMGQNIFPFFLRDPFDIILYLTGKDLLAYGIGYKECIKVITGGMLFFLYLRTLSLHPFVCIVGSLLFAFSGFMILGGGWYLFSYEAVNVALLLLAFEKFFQNKSFVLFPIAIALIGISMPFNLYVYGLFIAVYAIFRFIDENGWNTKAFFLLSSKLILYGLLGVGLSAFFLFGNVLQLLESPRGSGGSSYFNTLISSPVFARGDLLQNFTSIMRFFSSDMLGSGINFKGWNNYLEAPIFYTGLLSILLFPSVFQFLDKRRKIIYAVFLAFWITPVVFPFFRYAFWLFTGDYYRAFSFFVSFSLLLFSLQGLSRIVKSSKVSVLSLLIPLFALLGVLLFFSSSSSGINSRTLNSDLMSLSQALLVLYAIVIYLLSNRSFSSYAQIGLLLILCFELSSFSSVTVNKRSIVTTEEFKSKTGYNDYTVDAVASLKTQDKSFYRIDKDYSSGPAIHASINDGLAQGYYGTSAYHSFNQVYYVKFLQALGIAKKGDEFDSRWAQGLRQRPVCEIIGNVKYFLSKQEYKAFSYDSVAQFGNVKVLENRYYLPLGFAYEKYLLRSDFDTLSVQQKDFTLLKGFFIDDAEKEQYRDLEPVNLSDTTVIYTLDLLSQDVQNLRKDTLAISDFSQNMIHGNITLDRKKLLFLSIPFDKGWTATVNGKPQELKIVDAGMTGLLLDKGSHAIELKFYPRLLNAGFAIFIASLFVYFLLIFRGRKQKRKILSK